MLLSQIITDPQRLQFRDAPYSEATVNGIFAEGINLAKFDTIPLIAASKSSRCDYIVAGDGHSRFEAIRRLAAVGRLPSTWAVDSDDANTDYHIPCRIVTAREARTLSWTANLSRDDFTPCEQAKVFRAMLDSGMAIEAVATASHRTAGYIRQTLPLNSLCRDIRQAMGLANDAGGIEAYIGKLLGAKFEQYKIQPAQQQELWHKVLKHADLTASFVRALLDKIGRGLSENSGTTDFLFAIPASVAGVMADMRDRAQMVRRAERGLSWLIQCKDAGVIDPDLKRLLDARGEEMLLSIRENTSNDAELIGRLCYAEA